MNRVAVKILGLHWLGRALMGGPRKTATYVVRRELRKAANRRIRRLR